MKQISQLLVSAIIQLVGNKRYMTDIEKLLARLDDAAVTPSEKQAVQYLIQDLRSTQFEQSRSRRMF